MGADILSLSIGRNAERTCKLCAALKLNEMLIELKERDAVATLIAKYQDIFVVEELGATHLTEHKIDTGDAALIKQYAIGYHTYCGQAHR